METTKQAKNHNSSVINEILNSITKAELLQTERKMSLAIKIADAIEKNGYSKSEFAKKIGKNNSEISKWISGTHNFTFDTLILLEMELDIKLINSDIETKRRRKTKVII